MCTDKVLTVKKMALELNSSEKRKVLNALLWDFLARARAKQQQYYNYINNYLDNCICCCISRGKNNNVFIQDNDYRTLVAEFGQTIVDKAIDHLSEKLLTGYRVTKHLTACRVFCESQQRYEVKHNKSNQQLNTGDQIDRMARL